MFFTSSTTTKSPVVFSIAAGLLLSKRGFFKGSAVKVTKFTTLNSTDDFKSLPYLTILSLSPSAKP